MLADQIIGQAFGVFGDNYCGPRLPGNGREKSQTSIHCEIDDSIIEAVVRQLVAFVNINDSRPNNICFLDESHDSVAKDCNQNCPEFHDLQQKKIMTIPLLAIPRILYVD